MRAITPAKIYIETAGTVFRKVATPKSNALLQFFYRSGIGFKIEFIVLEGTISEILMDSSKNLESIQK
jgi:hypothetical protein